MSQKKQFYINFLAQLLYTAVNLSVNFFLVPKIINNINATAYGFISLSTDFVNYIGLITVALNALSSRYIIINKVIPIIIQKAVLLCDVVFDSFIFIFFVSIKIINKKISFIKPLIIKIFFKLS